MAVALTSHVDGATASAGAVGGVAALMAVAIGLRRRRKRQMLTLSRTGDGAAPRTSDGDSERGGDRGSKPRGLWSNTVPRPRSSRRDPSKRRDRSDQRHPSPTTSPPRASADATDVREVELVRKRTGRRGRHGLYVQGE